MLGARLWGGLSSISNSRFSGRSWARGAPDGGARFFGVGFGRWGRGLDYGADYAAVD